VGGYTTEQARELAALSQTLSRQIGLLIDRQGKVERVLIGTAGGILIPELSRSRSGPDRLRGVRLVHTHLTADGLSHEDLMDLLFLRLDSIGALTVNSRGEPACFQFAHLLPLAPGDTPYSVSALVPWDQVKTDFAGQTRAIEDEFGRIAIAAHEAGDVPRALLVSVSPLPRQTQAQHLDELAELARTAGLEVTGTLIQRVTAVHPRHMLGAGKLAELEVLALRGRASTIVFDGELSPAQLHGLAERTERRVLDRTQVILDIFARRAATRAGKLQVEMAQLNYTLPRLAGKNRAMDRLMGGIGGRGPGETKLETDRRRVRERLTRVKEELESVRRHRATNRAGRSRRELPLVALVGYTNAGKSTLFNALTCSDVLVEDKLFATLDPTTRRLRVPGEQELVLADTVGFIRNLPRELLDAFRATLEELEEADLLLHVVDASRENMEQQMASVDAILADLALHDRPRLLVFNKWDQVEEPVRDNLLALHPAAVPVSARNREGLEPLSLGIAERMRAGTA
jgi:GTP-binding protein HflX